MKLFRKEQRKVLAERERQAVLRSNAEQLAKTRGFDVMARMLSERGIPRGWQFEECGRDTTVSFVDATGGSSYRQLELSVREFVRGKNGESELCRATCQRYACGVEGFVENSAGEPLVVWLRDSSCEPSAPYAVAILDGVVGLVSMPDMVRPELFMHREPVATV